MKWALVLSVGLFLWADAPIAEECSFSTGNPHEVGQVACCCYDAWGNQCCAWVYVCPGPVPGCPCAY